MTETDPKYKVLNLGILVGQNQTFALIGGRCSAAQAESLRRLRYEKRYKSATANWNDFCSQFLNMSGSQADNVIRLYEEFGPNYFDLSQITRVSPDTYRALAPSIEDGVLKLNGKQIALTLENSRKVVDAVNQLRRATPAKPPSPHNRIDRLGRLCTQIAGELEAHPIDHQKNYQDLRAVVARLTKALDQLRAYFAV